MHRQILNSVLFVFQNCNELNISLHKISEMFVFYVSSEIKDRSPESSPSPESVLDLVIRDDTVKEHVATISNLQKERETQLETITNLQKESESHLVTISALQKETESQSVTLLNLQKENELQLATISDLEREKESHLTTISNLEKEKESMLTEIGANTTKYEELRQYQLAIDAQNLQHIEALKTEIQKIQNSPTTTSDSTTMTDEVRIVDEEKERAKERERETQRVQREKQQEQHQKEQLNQQQDEFNQLNQRYDALEKKYEGAMSELEEFKVLKGIMQEERWEIQKETDALKLQLQEQESKFEEKIREMKALEEQYEALKGKEQQWLAEEQQRRNKELEEEREIDEMADLTALVTNALKYIV